MTSKRNLSSQLGQTIANLEEEIAAIEAERRRLTRLAPTQSMGKTVPSQMSSPMGGVGVQTPDVQPSKCTSFFDAEFNELPKTMSYSRDRACGRDTYKVDSSAVQFVDKPFKPIVEPDNYDGRTNLEDWLTNLNLCCQINGWTKEQKTKFLAVRLRGPALQVYTDLPDINKSCLEDVVRALRERFSPVGQIALYRAQLKARSRGKNEPLPELASDLRRLVSKAYPNVSALLREELGRDYFIEALDSPDIRMQVRRAKPKDLGGALTIALEEEAFFQVEYNKANFLQKRGVNACQTKPNESVLTHTDGTKQEELNLKVKQLEQTVQELQLALKQKSATTRKGPLICWNCRQEGHRHFECPNSQPTRADDRQILPQENSGRLSMGPVPSQ